MWNFCCIEFWDDPGRSYGWNTNLQRYWQITTYWRYKRSYTCDKYMIEWRKVPCNTCKWFYAVGQAFPTVRCNVFDIRNAIVANLLAHLGGWLLVAIPSFEIPHAKKSWPGFPSASGSAQGHLGRGGGLVPMASQISLNLWILEQGMMDDEVGSMSLSTRKPDCFAQGQLPTLSMHAFVCLFVCLFVRSFVCSFVQCSFITWC